MASETILDVAIRQFGDRGFEGASTRAIAAAANTVMSSITYHFGGKEGLYLACADHIAAHLAERFAPIMAEIGSPADMDRQQATEATCALIEEIALLMMSDESRDWTNFLIREQQNPGPAFERLYSGIMHHMVELLRALIVRARPELDASAIRALGIGIFGQALVLRAARATVIRVLDVSEIGETEKKLLLDQIRYNIKALLRSDPPS